MNTEGTSKRQELIDGLRQLADFYEQNPDMPAENYPQILHGVSAGNDVEGVAEVVRIAGLLGVNMRRPGEPFDTSRHYVASRHFGPIEFRVYYIPESEQDNRTEIIRPGDTIVRADGGVS